MASSPLNLEALPGAGIQQQGTLTARAANVEVFAHRLPNRVKFFRFSRLHF
jgi:hypothetical protein